MQVQQDSTDAGKGREGGGGGEKRRKGEPRREALQINKNRQHSYQSKGQDPAQQLELREQRLISVEGSDGHEVRQRLVVLVGSRNELGYNGAVLDALHVHTREKGVLQNGASGSLRDTNAPVQRVN